jgi:PilZ domain-containing protein
MPFSIRSFQRFPVYCSAAYSVGPFQGQGTVWNLSCMGWRLSGDLPMRPGETLSLTVTLPNEQHIEIPEAVVRWSRGQEFAVENISIEPHTQARLKHYVKRLVRILPEGSRRETRDSNHSRL